VEVPVDADGTATTASAGRSVLEVVGRHAEPGSGDLPYQA
jgi:hypothetical protein